MVGREWFEETTEQSAVKRAIVSKYFFAWATIMLGRKVHARRIAYVDLFAGPGRYEDGTDSTPLLVLGRAIEDSALRTRLITLFNDRDSVTTKSLRKAIDALPGIERLAYRPRVTTCAVGSEIMELVDEVRRGNTPTLFFVDPWGYKGVSLALINAAVRDWGCDCIFFFNYNRVNPALANPRVWPHMDALFGEERAASLQLELNGLDPQERELVIVERLTEALSMNGVRLVLPFTFKKPGGVRTSHHLIFVTKDETGYAIMKEIMAKQSTELNQGVATFQYNPATVRQPLLFSFCSPLDDLEGMLLKDFAGRQLTFEEIYRRHNIGRPYIRSNYREALGKLAASGKIQVSYPPWTRPWRKGKPTFGQGVTIRFPAAEA